MKTCLMTSVFAAFLLGPFVRHAEAYGWDGHKIVCAIAYGLLAPEDRGEIDRFVRLYRTPDNDTIGNFPTSCTFADSARRNARDERRGWTRFNQFNNWHFLNVPRNVRQVRQSYCGGDCVLEALEHHLALFGDSSLADKDRAEALFFLAHWVADVHQPLHVSYADDLGGNETGLISGGYYESSNMHALWDNGIASRALAGRDWSSYARVLASRISEGSREAWLLTGPQGWAQESYDLTTSPEFQYCDWRNERCRPIEGVRVLGPAYQNEFQGVFEQRLQQAGVRLARLIEHALDR